MWLVIVSEDGEVAELGAAAASGAADRGGSEPDLGEPLGRDVPLVAPAVLEALLEKHKGVFASGDATQRPLDRPEVGVMKPSLRRYKRGVKDHGRVP